MRPPTFEEYPLHLRRIPSPSSKNTLPIFEEYPLHLRRTPHLRRTLYVRYFGLEDRRISHLLLSEPKNEEPPFTIFDLQPRRSKKPPSSISGFEEPVESKTRTYYRRVGSGRRTAGQRVGAKPGRTARRRIGPPGDNCPSYPSRRREQLS